MAAKSSAAAAPTLDLAGAAKALEDATAALRRGDPSGALEAALRAWSKRPDAGVARGVEALAASLESPRAKALRALEPAQVEAAWQALARGPSAADRGALLETVHRGPSTAILARVEAVARWPADPRTGTTLAQWLLHLPFRATSMKPTWGVVWELALRYPDERVLATLREAGRRGFAVGVSMGDWLREKRDKAEATLSAACAAAPVVSAEFVAAREAFAAALEEQGLASPSESASDKTSERASSASESAHGAPASPPSRALEREAAQGFRYEAGVRGPEGGVASLSASLDGALELRTVQVFHEYEALTGELRDLALVAIDGLAKPPEREVEEDLARVDDATSGGRRDGFRAVSEATLWPRGEPGPRWALRAPGVWHLALDGSHVAHGAELVLRSLSVEDGRERWRRSLDEPGFLPAPPEPAGSDDPYEVPERAAPVHYRTHEDEQAVRAVAAGPAGLVAFFVRDRLYLYRPGAESAEYVGSYRSYEGARLRFDAAGETLLVASPSDYLVWDVRASGLGAVLLQAASGNESNSYADEQGLAPDGGAVWRVLRNDPERGVRVEDARTGAPLASLAKPAPLVKSSERARYHSHASDGLHWRAGGDGGALEPYAVVAGAEFELAAARLSLRTGASAGAVVGGLRFARSVALAPDGALVSVVWANARQRALALFRLGESAPWHTVDAGAGASFSPDGEGWYVRSRVSLQRFDVRGKSPKARWSARAHAYQVHDVRASSDGRYVASASEDATVSVWNAADGEAVVQLKGHAGAARAVAFHPLDSDLLLSGGRDGALRLWSARRGACVRAWPLGAAGAKAPLLTSVGFSADGRFALGGALDGALYVFALDDASEAPRARLALGAGVTALAVRDDDGLVLCATQAAEVLALRSLDAGAKPEALAQRWLGYAPSLALGAEGSLLAVAAGASGRAEPVTLLRDALRAGTARPRPAPSAPEPAEASKKTTKKPTKKTR